jgi:hypothetical protein
VLVLLVVTIMMMFVMKTAETTIVMTHVLFTDWQRALEV